MHNVLNPLIKWGLYYVYYRLPDGRTMYFRGSRRVKIFVKNFKTGKDGDWVWEKSGCRLFQIRPIISEKSLAKPLRNQENLNKINFSGFPDMVESTHLLMPERIPKM